MNVMFSVAAGVLGSIVLVSALECAAGKRSVGWPMVFGALCGFCVCAAERWAS